MGILIDESDIARTYSHPSVADTYDIVKQYREAMRFGPDVGSTQISRQLEIPRARVRPWLDGAKPDSIRAIETANELGWLESNWTPQIRALTELCSGIFACGSIEKKGMRPTWCPSTNTGTTQIENALETAGVGFRLEDKGRTPELWPKSHSSVLGRVLIAAGAPVGSKNSDTVRGLPEWLSVAPQSVKVTFVKLIIQERGINQQGKATKQIRTAREPMYFKELARLVESVSGERATWSETGTVISADAVRSLDIE